MPLSEDQKRRIEENRLQALAKRNNVNSLGSPNVKKIPKSSTIKPIQTTRSPAGPGAAWALSKQNEKATPIPLPLTSLLPSKAPAKLPYQNKTSTVPNKYNDSKSKGANISQFYGKSKTVKAKFILLDPNSFKIDMAFHPGAITIFKTITSSQYNASDRTWSFSLKDHNNLARNLRPLQPEVQLDPLPRWVLETFNCNNNNTKIEISNPNDSINQDTDNPEVEPCLWDNLMPFQRDGVRYALERNGRILLADDMGLGKTIQALGIASAFKSKWPLLIVCPSSMRYAWRSAVMRWLPSIPVEDIKVILSGSDDIDPGDQVMIISYNLVSRKERDLIDCNFQVAILDESHFLKDYKSIRFKSVETILKAKVNHLVMLSGTPALSRPIELFTQISLLEPKLFKFVNDFGMRYCDGRKMEFGQGKSVYDFSGHSNMTELKLLMEKRFMIRRLKSEVLTQLPSKMREMIILDPSLVKSKSKVMQDKALSMSQITNKSKEHALLLEWFHLTCDAKAKAVCEYVKDLLESDKKFLIFAHHQVSYDKPTFFIIEPYKT